MIGFQPIALIFITNTPNTGYDLEQEDLMYQLLISSQIPPSYDKAIITTNYIPSSKIALSTSACRVIVERNAGGRSEVSEAISVDYFEKIFQAKDVIIEMEVEYWISYSMVDYICTIGSNRIGVSVTRAMGFHKYPSPTLIPRGLKKGYLDDSLFTQVEAEALLRKKLTGLIVSRNAVTDKHTFFRSVLHVWCQSQRIADLVKEEFEKYKDNDFGLDVQGSLILFLTVCDWEGLYFNTRDGLVLG